MQKLMLAALIALAACAAQPGPEAAPSGITSNNGGGMRPLGTTLGTTRVQ